MKIPLALSLMALYVLYSPLQAQAARDGIVVAADGRQYVYHVRAESEVASHCAGRLGCIGEKHWTTVTPVWLVDSLRVALYLCARIEGGELTTKVLESIPTAPAPVPMCIVDRHHTGAEQRGRMMPFEEWQAMGGVAPMATGVKAPITGSIVDVMLDPLLGKIIVRDMSSVLVVEIRPGVDGAYRIELPVGLYFFRLKLDDGRTEGPLMLAVGSRGHTLPWIAGLSE